MEFLFSQPNHCPLTQWPALAEAVLPSLCSAQQMHSSTTKANSAHLDQNAPNKPLSTTETSPPPPHAREVSNVVWPSHGPSRPFQPRKVAIFFGVKPLPFLPFCGVSGWSVRGGRGDRVRELLGWRVLWGYGRERVCVMPRRRVLRRLRRDRASPAPSACSSSSAS